MLTGLAADAVSVDVPDLVYAVIEDAAHLAWSTEIAYMGVDGEERDQVFAGMPLHRRSASSATRTSSPSSLTRTSRTEGQVGEAPHMIRSGTAPRTRCYASTRGSVSP